MCLYMVQIAAYRVCKAPLLLLRGRSRLDHQRVVVCPHDALLVLEQVGLQDYMLVAHNSLSRLIFWVVVYCCVRALIWGTASAPRETVIVEVEEAADSPLWTAVLPVHCVSGHCDMPGQK